MAKSGTSVNPHSKPKNCSSMTAGTWRKHQRFQACRPAGGCSAGRGRAHLCTLEASCHTLFICERSPPRTNRCPPWRSLRKTDAPYQITGFGPCPDHHRAGGALDASRQGARGPLRAAVRRHCRDRLRQGFVVRTRCRKMRIPGRRAVRPSVRHVRGGSPTLHCTQTRQKFSAGVRLQQQNLFERLLPARLPGREISRWKVLMETGRRATHDPLFRHIIAYKLPRSCGRSGIAGANRSAVTRPSSRGG